MKAYKFFVLAQSSVFGLGYMPKAPGTWGTLGAIPIWWAISSLSWPVATAIIVAIVIYSIVISELADKIYGTHDVGKIVIDEVAGMLVTIIAVPFKWPLVIVAFVVFRVLDITKPGPIRWVDHHVKGGLGVVLDDVAAGVAGCLVLHGARLVYGGWW